MKRGKKKRKRKKKDGKRDKWENRSNKLLCMKLIKRIRFKLVKIMKYVSRI